MKTYMPLDGLRWSRDSGSAHCDMPKNAVLGRAGGGKNERQAPPHHEAEHVMILKSG